MRLNSSRYVKRRVNCVMVVADLLQIHQAFNSADFKSIEAAAELHSAKPPRQRGLDRHQTSNPPYTAMLRPSPPRSEPSSPDSVSCCTPIVRLNLISETVKLKIGEEEEKWAGFVLVSLIHYWTALLFWAF